MNTYWISATLSKLMLLGILISVLYTGGKNAQNNPLVDTVWEVETVSNIWENFYLYRRYFPSKQHIPGAKQITINDFQQDKIRAEVVDSLGQVYDSNVLFENMPYIRYRMLFTDTRMYVWLLEGERRYFVAPYQVHGDSIHIIHRSRGIDINGPFSMKSDTLIIEEDVTSPTDVYYYRYIYRFHQINTLNTTEVLKQIKRYRKVKGFDLSMPQNWP